MRNNQIASQFLILSKLMEIHGENAFKAKSYANAAFAIGKLPFQIEEAGIEAIEGERGIGKGVISAILQLMDDGYLAPLEDLKAKTPKGIMELLAIRGVGPKKIGQLWKELNIETPTDLLNACYENKLTTLKGFGAKTQQTILENIEYYFQFKGSLLWSQAGILIDNITQTLQGLFPDKQFEFLGEYYWQNEIVQSFTIIINTPQISLPEQDWTLIQEENDIKEYRYREHLKFSFICVPESEYERNKFHYSFSNDAREKIDLEKLVNFENEQQAFQELGMSYLPPFLRNNPKAVERAKTMALPRIIENNDIKGIIHNHTNWSDGANSIEEMAKACIEKGYEYFVLSDHSKTSFYANGLSEERIIQQQKEIDKLNETLSPFRIYKSIECDILGDGSLDYEESVLQSFDIVIASVHQNLTMDIEKAMSRLLRAIENPFTSILGHPTGRLLLSREGYPIDHKKIIDACAANEVVIEINANPRRLDLDWRWIEYALEKEVLLSINPDAHTIHGIDDVMFGILVAQKGMLTAAMNLSSFTKDEFEEFLFHQHQKRG